MKGGEIVEIVRELGMVTRGENTLKKDRKQRDAVKRNKKNKKGAVSRRGSKLESQFDSLF